MPIGAWQRSAILGCRVQAARECLHAGRDRREGLPNELLQLWDRPVKITHNVERGVGREVPFLPELHDLVPLPLFNLNESTP